MRFGFSGKQKTLSPPLLREPFVLRLKNFANAKIIAVCVASSFVFSAFGQSALQPETKAEPTPSPAAIAAIKNSGENSETPSPKSEPSVIAEDLIHFGDVIDVDVLGSLEYDWRGSLDSEGFLSQLPFTENPIFALCRTETELAGEIADAYKKVLRQPEVVVRLVDRSSRQPGMLLGAVRTQYRLQIERPVRLNELVVIAGGITERASGEVTVFRPSNLSCSERKENQTQSETLKVKLTDLLSGKEEANPFIRTGDVVTIEEAKPILVFGGVAAPQTVWFREQITLSRALASAGGLSKDGDPAKITIYRRSGGDSKIINANFDSIRKKAAEDITLEAYDVVEVEQRGRGREKRPPLPAGWDAVGQNTGDLPLRVIN